MSLFAKETKLSATPKLERRVSAPAIIGASSRATKSVSPRAGDAALVAGKQNLWRMLEGKLESTLDKMQLSSLKASFQQVILLHKNAALFKSLFIRS